MYYYLKDHLGNVRVVKVGVGEGGSVQDYLYSGKELTRFNALNWYNYGARWYDPAILRWNGVDGMAEKYTYVSPYSILWPIK